MNDGEKIAERLELQAHILFAEDILIDGLKTLLADMYSNAQSLESVTKATQAIQAAINTAKY